MVELVELVKDKRLNTGLGFLEVPSADYLKFSKENTSEINIMSFKPKSETNKLNVKKEFRILLHDTYQFNEINKKIADSQEDFKNCKWYNWHFPFMPRYWKEMKDSVGDEKVMDFFSNISCVMGTGGMFLGYAFSPDIIGIPAMLTAGGLVGKAFSEKDRRKMKKSLKNEINYLTKIQETHKKITEPKIQNAKINIVYSKKAHEVYEPFLGLDNQSREMIDLYKLNETLREIYRKER